MQAIVRGGTDSCSGGTSCSACGLPGRQPPTPLAVARGILAMSSVRRVARPLTRASEARIRNVSPRGRLRAQPCPSHLLLYALATNDRLQGLQKEQSSRG